MLNWHNFLLHAHDVVANKTHQTSWYAFVVPIKKYRNQETCMSKKIQQPTML